MIEDKGIYVTFGQDHVHKIDGILLDKDCVVICESRDRAFELFGPKFCFAYPEQPDMKYYPRGLIDLRG